jgi:hypothetical protein
MRINISLINGKMEIPVMVTGPVSEQFNQIMIDLQASDAWDEAKRQAQEISESTGEVMLLTLDLNPSITVVSQAKPITGEVAT